MRRTAIALFCAGILGGSTDRAFAQYGGYGWGGWGGGGASTVGGSIARGMGVYGAGLGQLRVDSAQAASINADTVMRVNNALYYGQMQNNYNAALHRQQKLQRINKAQADIYTRMRDTPNEHDITNGDALNVQLDLLLNPKVYSAVLQSIRTPISKDMIKEIPFEYASEGVTVCLNELTLDENLPPALREDVYKPYIADFHKAMDVALDEDIKGDLKPSTNKTAAAALSRLKAAFDKNVPNTDPDYYPTANFLKGMAGMVRMLHKPDVEEVIAGLEKAPNTNLGELLGFMHAYSLRFGPAETAEQKQIYQDLYPILVSAPKALPASAAQQMGSVVADAANVVRNGAANASKELGGAAADFFKPADPASFAPPPPAPK
jgi:hypothetical protein